MEAWARRIEQRLTELADQGKTEAGIARACKIAKNSVSQWFGRVKGKLPTEKIMGAPLVATAAYLDTTAEWIMTGQGAKVRSQDAGLDPQILASAFVAADKALRAQGLKFDAAQVPEFLIFAYRERLEYPLDADKSVLAAYDRNVLAELQRGKFSVRETHRPIDTGDAGQAAQAAPDRKNARSRN
jgi:hypothetical protein